MAKLKREQYKEQDFSNDPAYKYAQKRADSKPFLESLRDVEDLDKAEDIGQKRYLFAYVKYWNYVEVEADTLKEALDKANNKIKTVRHSEYHLRAIEFTNRKRFLGGRYSETANIHTKAEYLSKIDMTKSWINRAIIAEDFNTDGYISKYKSIYRIFTDLFSSTKYLFGSSLIKIPEEYWRK